ncbi:hypothetical protein D3C77_146820 [compost metagenome]
MPPKPDCTGLGACELSEETPIRSVEDPVAERDLAKMNCCPGSSAELLKLWLAEQRAQLARRLGLETIMNDLRKFQSKLLEIA